MMKSLERSGVPASFGIRFSQTNPRQLVIGVGSERYLESLNCRREVTSVLIWLLVQHGHVMKGKKPTKWTTPEAFHAQALTGK
jgi:hypothetical protein